MKSWQLLILLSFGSLSACTPLLAQEQKGEEDGNRQEMLWAVIAPGSLEPPTTNNDPASVDRPPVDEIWTGAGYKGGDEPKLNLNCHIDKEVEGATLKLIAAVKQVYSKRGWNKQLEELLRQEPKDCPLNIALYRLSIARQVLEDLSKK